MYFSAIARFSIGLILVIIGYRSVRKANHPNQYLFAYIPILFAFQQFTEGILRLILPDSHHIVLEKTATYVFVVTAQVIMPVWLPLSVLLLEKNKVSRKILSVLTAGGILVSLFFTWCLIIYGALGRVGGHHICYQENFPVIFNEIEGYFYILVVVFPPFFSRFKRMWILGLAIFISYLVTKIYYDNYLISIWSFFGAIISTMVYWVLMEIRRTRDGKPIKDAVSR